jgi:hypothetical protein
MKDLFSAFGFNDSGPLAVLRELLQVWIKVLGPLIDVLRPLWDQVVAFLRGLSEQLAEQYEQDQERASWGRPELGWAE